MLEITLREMWARRRRFLGMSIAILLGVAFLSGTLALNDTIRANFDNLFTTANASTDAVVRSATTTGEGNAVQRATIPASLLDTARGVSGVAGAQPYVEAWGQILGADGTAVGGNGPPRLASSWVDDPALTPWRIAEGRAPQTDGEAVINRGAAKSGNLHVGDTTTVLTPEPLRVRIVGIATFGDADGFGPETYVAFTLHQAEQALLHRTDLLTEVRVRAASGVSQQDVTSRLRPLLPAGAQAITGTQLTADQLDTLSAQFLNFLQGFLVIFAAIALLVATLVIHNAFAVLVAQRSRETALLRAIGATRRQILAGLAVEALLVGVLAGGAGVLCGIGIASLLKLMFAAFGFTLPTGGLTITAGTLILSLAVGLGATLVSALAPSLMSSRVPPVAAMRDVASGRKAVSRTRLAGGVAALVLGLGALIVGPVSGRLAIAGLGALVTIVGVVALGPLGVSPLAALVGAPLRRLRGVVGSLARENARRNPRRTSGTASALMVGIAVAALLTVLVGSLRATVRDDVAASVQADIVVASGSFGGGGIGPRLVDDVSRLPQVRTATGLGSGSLLVEGTSQKVGVVDPAHVGGLLDVGVSSGSLSALGPAQFAVSDSVAADKGWHVGSPVNIVFPDGSASVLTVAATYSRGAVAGTYLVAPSAWSPHALETIDSAVLIGLRDGADVSAARTAVSALAARYGRPDVVDGQGYVDSRVQFFATMLGLVDIMLVLAIVIAALGIATTLSLAVNERVRELGLMRALGATASQVRAVVRWESVIVAVVGTAAGIAVGLVTGWALVRTSTTASGTMTFAVPVAQMIPIVLVGAAVGVLAAVRPARRAARVDILRALGAE